MIIAKLKLYALALFAGLAALSAAVLAIRRDAVSDARAKQKEIDHEKANDIRDAVRDARRGDVHPDDIEYRD